MQRKVTRKQAAVFVTLLAGITAILFIWPLRLFSTIVTCTGPGEILGTTEEVSEEADAGDYFLAQYSHLDTLEVWIEPSSGEGTFTARLFHVKEDGSVENIAEESVEIPGEASYVTIPIDVDMTPGDTYIYILYGDGSATFRAGLESAEVPDDPAAILYVNGFYNDTGIDGLVVATRLNYKVPLPKGQSLFWIGILGVLILAALGIEFLFFRKPGRNRTTTVLSCMRYVLTPAAAVLAALGMLAVFPGKMFDDRALDIVVYEIGIALSLAWLLYGLWHKRTDPKEPRPVPWRHLFISVCIALNLAASVDYMNALNDLLHDNAEYRIALFSFLMILLMGELTKGQRILTGSVSAVTALAAIRYAMTHTAALDDPERAEKNWILFFLCAAYVAGAAAIAAAVSTLVLSCKKSGRAGTRGKNLPLWISFAVFAVLLLVFRNGRRWIWVLVLVSSLFLVRFALWKERSRWLSDLTLGVVFQFTGLVIFTLLRRYYFAYAYSRFSMMFHTVTETAYYLLAVFAFAAALFVGKLPRLYAMKGEKLSVKLDFIWKEALFFGVVSSYMLMTLSRAGVFGMVIVAFFALAVVLIPRRRFFRGLLSMLTAFILVLPAAFTLQRIVPVTVRHPQRFEEIEPFPDAVERNMTPDSRWFMSVEIFVRDIGDRLIGGEIGTKIYTYFDWNQYIEKKDPSIFTYLQDHTDPLTTGTPHPVLLADAAASDSTSTGSIDTGDYSNGRLSIWKSYLAELNLSGHDTMGVTLVDGTTAVHAHNTLLQLCYDCGIPTGAAGGIFFVLTLIGCCIYYRRRKSGESLIPLFLAIGFGVTGLVEWIFHFCNPYTILFFLGTAPVFFQDRRKPENLTDKK